MVIRIVPLHVVICIVLLHESENLKDILVESDFQKDEKKAETPAVKNAISHMKARFSFKIDYYNYDMFEHYK